MVPLLNHQIFGDKKNASLIILHGLLGCADNWRSLAKKFSENFFVIAVDLRNHGSSFHHPSMTYADMANDVFGLIETLNLSDVMIIGHSMGGKVLMQMLAQDETFIKKAIIVDIAPKAYDYHHLAMLNFISSLELKNFSTRTELDKALSTEIKSSMIRNFVLKNIKKDERGFYWQVNLPAILQAYPHIMSEILSNHHPKISCPTLFIAGEKSTYIQESDHQRIYELFDSAEIVICSQAGHWVQAENPDEFCSIVIKFLDTKHG
jgi:esterase